MSNKVMTLAQLVYKQSLEQPHNPALVIANVPVTYHVLANHAKNLASQIKSDGRKRIGILASRTLAAYAGVLAAQWSGVTFVSLNPSFPLLRLQKIIQSAALDVIITDITDLALLKTICEPFSIPYLLLQTTETCFNILPAQVDTNDLAYILFTSGSTGEPKGVPVSYGNFSTFVHAASDRYALSPDDRVSQFSHLTFDVAFFDMILAWGAGASLYVVPDTLRIAPGAFIFDNALTVWLSVPAIISNLKKLKMLKENAFPSLKYSLFTGDVLYADQVALWQSAAPNSRIDNLYGPTEATIDCLGYSVISGHQDDYTQGKIPIGKPFPGMIAALINEKNEFVFTDGTGELVLSGSQVVTSYWQLPALSQEKFISLYHPEYGSQRWYRTGDMCRLDHQGNFHYLRRLDKQCKFLGYRIELEEIEFYLRQLTNSEVVALVSHPESENPQLVAVIQHGSVNEDSLRQQLYQYLPAYMIPTRFIAMKNFPYSHHDKVDRNQLREMVLGL